VGYQEVMADNPGLGWRIAKGAQGPVRGVARGVKAGVIAQDGAAPGLIEGDPVLALGDRLEDDTGVVLEVQGELGPVQEAAVPPIQGIRKVPVVEGNHGGDASIKQVVDELDVVVDAGLVDGVIAATERDNGDHEREKR